MQEGIDIANVNGTVDLAHEKQARGLSFVFHKATEGLGFVDGRYSERRAQAKALGLVWGAYHFAHPANNAVQEADYFLQHASLQAGDLAALDLEATDGRSWADVAAWADAFCGHVGGVLGRPCSLYGNRSYLQSMPTTNLTKYPLWAAEPGNSVAPPYLDRWSSWTFHQYGISGGLDQDHFNGSLTDLLRLAGSSAPADPCPKRIPWAGPGPYPYGDAPEGEKAVPVIIQGQVTGVDFVPCP